MPTSSGRRLLSRNPWHGLLTAVIGYVVRAASLLHGACRPPRGDGRHTGVGGPVHEVFTSSRTAVASSATRSYRRAVGWVLFCHDIAFLSVSARRSAASRRRLVRCAAALGACRPKRCVAQARGGFRGRWLCTMCSVESAGLRLPPPSLLPVFCAIPRRLLAMRISTMHAITPLQRRRAC